MPDVLNLTLYELGLLLRSGCYIREYKGRVLQLRVLVQYEGEVGLLHPDLFNAALRSDYIDIEGEEGNPTTYKPTKRLLG